MEVLWVGTAGIIASVHSTLHSRMRQGSWALLTLGVGWVGGTAIAIADWSLPPVGWDWLKMSTPLAIIVGVTLLALIPGWRAWHPRPAV